MASLTPTNDCEDRTVTPLHFEAPTSVGSAMSIASEPLIKPKEDIGAHSSVIEQPQNRDKRCLSIDTHASSLPQLGTGVNGEVDSPAGGERVCHTVVALTQPNVSVKNHALKFTIESICGDEEPCHVEWTMFNIFNDLLQPDTKLSVAEAARCFDAMLPDNRPNTPDDPDTEKERAENWLWTLAEIIWEFAKQIPYDHESQGKIILLLGAVDRLPFTQTFEGKHFWTSKLLGWDDPSRWAVADSRPRQKPQAGRTRRQECNTYLNAMAFTARCAGIDWPHYDLIIVTLDEPLSPDYLVKTCDGLDHEFMYIHVAAAAQWILHAGEWLWGQIRWGKNQGLDGTKRCLPPAQWAIWMRGYYTMGTQCETIHFWADVLARKMEEIMTAHGYTEKIMMNWDPKKHTVHDGIRENPRYAHLFRVSNKDGE